jgi:ribosomal protein S1
VRYVPYGVFVRVYEDINGLVHLSELSQKTVNNPNEIVKLGQIVKAKLILIDPKNRKIGLSMKDLEPKAEGAEEKPAKKAAKSK